MRSITVFGSILGDILESRKYQYQVLTNVVHLHTFTNYLKSFLRQISQLVFQVVVAGHIDRK